MQLLKETLLTAVVLSFDIAHALSTPPHTQLPPPPPSDIRNRSSAYDQYGQGQNMTVKVLEGETDTSCEVEPYDAPSIDHQEYPSYDEQVASVYRYRRQQSVNLGSWFVHEPWMTPSPFKCAAGNAISEIDIAYGWGNTSNARSVLERHWDTFITPSDFQWLADIGINTVRLPIGYWNLGSDFSKGTDFEAAAEVYQNSWARVKRAVNIAGEHGLGVLVDLHAAPGSQNGKEHSGVSNGAIDFFSDTVNQDKTVDALTFLVKEFVHVNNVVGIQVLNEPAYDDRLTDFYSRAVDTMRQSDPDASRLPLYVHNGFDLQRFLPFVAGRNDFVVQDHHAYFVHTEQDRQRNASQHTADVETRVASELEEAAKETKDKLIVGEWSCALTPESVANEPNEDQARKEFCEAQLQCYSNQTAGWSFWTYLKEGCDDDPGWCFKSAVGKVLPSSFSSWPDANANSNQNIARLNLSSVISSTELPLLQYAKLSTRTVPERFESIARKRIRQEASSDLESKGYEDGKKTAEVFAAHNMSRLGFVEQYIHDTFSTLGLSAESETPYTENFLRGLHDSEKEISASS